MAETQDITDRMDPANQELKTELEQVWDKYVNQARTTDPRSSFQVGGYLADPLHPGIPTHFEIMEPLTYVGTESYQDNQEVLEVIDERCLIDKNNQDAIIVVGDQQTFDRMMHLKRMKPVDYKHIVPFNGEMHFCAHMAHAIWRLNYNKFLMWLVATLKFDKTCKDDWSVKTWSYYDDFLFIITAGLLQYLTEVVPADYLGFSALRNAAQNNADLLMLVRFLQDFALPYLEVRQLVRSTSTLEMRRRMNLYYNLTLHMCRTEKANKYLYAIVCVQAVWLYHNAIPSLRKVWEGMSTVSLRGYRGRNVAIDHLCEKVNKYSKQIVGTQATEDRIKKMVPALNVCMPVEQYYFETAGGPEAEEDGEEASAKKADRLATIAEVVKVLKGVVGGDWMTASRQKDDLTFVCFASARDGRMPWEMVEEKQADWRRYVEANVEAKQGEITM